MVIKMADGAFKKEGEVTSTENSYKKISLEDTYVINNFFDEEYIGIFDRDTFSFINTKIKYVN